MIDTKDLYYGFDSARQKEYEQYLIKYHGTKSEDLLFESQKRTAQWGQDQWDDVKNQGDLIYKDLAKAIEFGLQPESDEVQDIMRRHYQLQNRFFDLRRDVYIGLADLYIEHPDFKKFFDVYHLQMIDFIGKAIRFYVQKNL